MKQDQEVSPKVRLITYAITSLLVVVMAVGSVGYTSYQRNQKLEQQKQAQIAAQLKKQQLANVEAIKATLPLFRSTKQGENKIMVKVNQSELPKTITLELENYGLGTDGNPDSYLVDSDGSGWGGAEVANGTTDSNGYKATWTPFSESAATDPAPTVSVTLIIPGSSTVGVHTLTASGTNGTADWYKGSVQFKIVPPCPTSVTLTH